MRLDLSSRIDKVMACLASMAVRCMQIVGFGGGSEEVKGWVLAVRHVWGQRRG